MNDLQMELREYASKHNLSSHIDLLTRHAEESIALIPSPGTDETLETGCSKLGGCPDVEPNFEWPRNKDGKPLSFVVQINLAEASKLATDVKLPDYGVLSFFYDNLCAGYAPDHKDGFRVIHFDDRNSKLTRMPPPEMPQKKLLGFIKIDQSVREFKPCRLSMKRIVTLPNDFEELTDHDDKFWDNYFEMLETIGGHHRLLGCAEPVQGEMRLECELVTNGLYCGDETGYKDPRAKELEKNEHQWRLLMQIASDEKNSDMMWGDLGKLYVWIKDEDLRSGNFHRSWFIMQCH